MTIPYSILLLVFFLRSVFGRHGNARYAAPTKEVPPSVAEPPANHEASRNSKLAGVPLWLLDSERSNPGALLRETLLHRPSSHDE